MADHGSGFSKQNLYRMMLFAEQFPDNGIVSELAGKLSWSHFSEPLSLKSDEARMYYANDTVLGNYGTKELRRQIAREAYERRKIAGFTWAFSHASC